MFPYAKKRRELPRDIFLDVCIDAASLVGHTIYSRPTPTLSFEYFHLSTSLYQTHLSPSVAHAISYLIHSYPRHARTQVYKHTLALSNTAPLFAPLASSRNQRRLYAFFPHPVYTYGEMRRKPNRRRIQRARMPVGKTRACNVYQGQPAKPSVTLTGRRERKSGTRYEMVRPLE